MAHLSSLSLPIPKPYPCLHRRHSKLFHGATTLSLSHRRSSPTRRKLSFHCQYSNSDPFPTFYSADSPPPPPPPSSGLPARVFVGHYIYKGKAALTLQPIAPEFTCMDSGSYKISREGIVLLQFAPASGVRVYDWSKKQVFSLSVTEIGTLISLGKSGRCEFYHDPQKGRSDEGQVKKILKVEPLPDGSGYYFNISVQNKLANLDDNIYIPITKGEYAVLVSAFNFIIPYLMGWHAFANNTKLGNTGPVNSGRYGGYSESEWSR